SLKAPFTPGNPRKSLGVASNATPVALFALAKSGGGQHMERAFQASSPKLPSPAGNSRAFFCLPLSLPQAHRPRCPTARRDFPAPLPPRAVCIPESAFLAFCKQRTRARGRMADAEAAVLEDNTVRLQVAAARQ